ncbi:GDP-mannose 4,6-dehydratase [Candidatus Lokiarchaeum ossiferum]|uniref:GDP-mannose 4,6-dehydratase n=1 Tax=Candidatus Lokiarchaeum ossiferum TaxID=2951803 RepID=A0ABY6HXC6_9ARCH|nr:GDP-mannose 4,6-dehydratase [Candidatus Lokiarchaeum sp. B-35]
MLVTGGAGFIGSHLVDYLIAKNHEVIVVDSLIDGYLENIQGHIDTKKCVFVQGDIRDKDLILNQLPVVDMIYHLAADPDVRASVPNPMTSYDHNMNGTMNLLEYMRLKGVKKMVFTSSGGTVYGDVDTFPMTEELVLKPISPYGASKAAAEMYLSAYANAYNIKIGVARYANIFGERSRHGVGFDFYHHLTDNPKELTILGDGLQQKSYLHVSDAIKATYLIGESLDSQEKWYDYYNVGSEEWNTVKEIASLFEKELGLTDVHHKFTGGVKGWVGDVAKMLLSVKKIETLGFSAQVSFEEGVHLYCEWLKKTYPKEN